MSESESEWERTRWWRSVGPDGKVWGESSNEAEIRSMARPGDTVQVLYRKVTTEYNWLVTDEDWRES